MFNELTSDLVFVKGHSCYYSLDSAVCYVVSFQKEVTTMGAATRPRSKSTRHAKTDSGRPAIGIRELKAKASAIVADVKRRRVTYAVTKHGTVEALIVPVDAGERLLDQPNLDSAWETWQALVAQLSRDSNKKTRSAVSELEQMRR
jgi:antitoxin (DNA-binding transcriptional repressor) of toxin-antitoxin stability system